MKYHSYQMPIKENRQPIENTILSEPYVERLRMITGRSVVVETVRGNLQGVLVDVKPDHIVVQSYDNDTVFYVRIQQIVHVMPINRKEISSEQLFD